MTMCKPMSSLWQLWQLWQLRHNSNQQPSMHIHFGFSCGSQGNRYKSHIRKWDMPIGKYFQFDQLQNLPIAIAVATFIASVERSLCVCWCAFGPCDEKNWIRRKMYVDHTRNAIADTLKCYRICMKRWKWRDNKWGALSPPQQHNSTAARFFIRRYRFFIVLHTIVFCASLN